MINGMVGLRDYEGVQGFGLSSAQDLDNLNKALTAGSQNPPLTGGNTLRVESLEATLRVVTHSLKHIRLWRELPKLPAFSTVEEYNRLLGYGADAGAWTNEGDLPETQDSTYERKTALVKFIGTTREVTHPMTMVRPAHGNVIALESTNGATWLLERLERSLFTGRSDVIAQEIDGMLPLIASGVGVNDLNADLYTALNTLRAEAQTVFIDKRGLPLLEDDLETAANNIVQNYGTPTDLWLAPQAQSSVNKQFYPRERINLPYPVDGKVGLSIKSFDSSAGLIQFQPDIFLRSGGNNGQKGPPSAATSSKAPNAPTFGTTAGANGASQFVAATAGTYGYSVTAINRFGESAPSSPGTQAIAAGEQAVITITDTGGANPATGYRVYRERVAGNGRRELCMTVKRDAATTVVNDRNYWIPGTSVAFMTQNNLGNYSIRQLAPMMKIPLATVAASIRWMQLLYLTFIIYTPRKNVVFINVEDS